MHSVNKSDQSKTTLKEKTILLLFGVFLSFLLLEIGMRLAGFTISFLEERRNKEALKQKGTYRIMCLGESTTAGGKDSYPSQLEEILNERSKDIKFSVINKGVRATNTSLILAKLEDNIQKYHPDMVLAMISINDGGQHMPHQSSFYSKSISSFKSLKIYNLFQYLWMYLRAKFDTNTFSQSNKKHAQALSNESDILESEKRLNLDMMVFEESSENTLELSAQYESPCIAAGVRYMNSKQYAMAEQYFKHALKINPLNEVTYIRLGNTYRAYMHIEDAKACYKQVLKLNPDNYQAYLEFARIYRDKVDYEKAVYLYKKVIEMDPKNDYALVELGRFYSDQMQYAEAKKLFHEAIEVNPQNDNAYRELACFVDFQGDFAKAVELYKKAIDINPQNPINHVRLGMCYREHKQYVQAEQCFKKAIEVEPKNEWSQAYIELAKLSREMGKYVQSEECFKQFIELHPDSDEAYGGLALTHQESGQKHQDSQEYGKKAELIRRVYVNPNSHENYLNIKRSLDAHEIQLICVQYPMRSILPLREIFREFPGVTIVDNENLFKEPVRSEGYDAIFVDMFAGDFGHCTRKGYRLLAENVADAVLKEVNK